MDQVSKALWIAVATSLPAVIPEFGKVSEDEIAIGIVFFAQRTCRLADRAGSKEAGRPTPVHASIVSSANRILNRCMLEKSMGAKDVGFNGVARGKTQPRDITLSLVPGARKTWSRRQKSPHVFACGLLELTKTYF